MSDFFVLFLIFCMSQGSVATRLSCDGKYKTALLRIYCKLQQWNIF